MPPSSNPRIGTTVTAPGKLVIVGEYAVIDDSAAIVLAIDRGVMCQVQQGSGITTPNGDTRFVAPILQGHTQNAHYKFQAWNPVDLPDKPGFGGSAAAVVAACLAVGHPVEQARAIHQQIQGGGSGIDVLASVYGGLLHIHRDVVTPIKPFVPSVIWSGQSAKTGPRVQQYLSWTDRADFIQTTTDLVTEFSSRPVEVLREAAILLEAMAQSAGIDYRTPGLSRIMALANDVGGAAKPSGAGGGDCAIALIPDPDARENFLSRCAEEDLTPIPVRVASKARQEPSHEHL